MRKKAYIACAKTWSLREPGLVRGLSAVEVLRRRVLVGHSSLVSASQLSGKFWPAESGEGTNPGVSHVLNGSENWEADQPARVRGSGIREGRKALM